MKFTKMQGCGNDYIYLNGFEEIIPDPSELAVCLSDRHYGIGGDGIVLIGPSEKADFSMRIFNKDGSEAEMCGNALRCVGKYVYDHRMTDQMELTIETKAGLRRVRLYLKENRVDSAEADMGMAIAERLSRELLSDAIPEELRPKILQIWTVSMGNPHCVFLLTEIPETEPARTGPVVECHPLFPQRTNVEFVAVKDRTELTMRVWERGSGETLACGTGACAAVAAAVNAGLTGRKVLVRLRGGDLVVTMGDQAAMSQRGAAITVFEGEIIPQERQRI